MKSNIYISLLFVVLMLFSGCIEDRTTKIEIDSIAYVPASDTIEYLKYYRGRIDIFKAARGIVVINLKSKLNIHKYASRKGATLFLRFNICDKNDDEIDLGLNKLLYNKTYIETLEYEEVEGARIFDKKNIIVPDSNGYYIYNVVLFVSYAVDKELPQLLESGDLCITIRGGAPFGMRVYKFKPIIITKDQIDGVLK
ncbi:MAG: hypothetical protein SFY80_15180 [Verrucomicrobiota bacterium]|nr:hypothetical protein [Verrucomicrobiota bacterium]